MEQQTPAADQQIVSRGGGEFSRIGPGQQHDLLRQRRIFGQPKFRLVDDLQERLATYHIALAVRNPQAEAG